MATREPVGCYLLKVAYSDDQRVARRHSAFWRACAGVSALEVVGRGAKLCWRL